jgi:hypothetical protein
MYFNGRSFVYCNSVSKPQIKLTYRGLNYSR